MVNWPALTGCFAAVVRPGLLLPDIAVKDIRSLDWKALYSAGVRGVIFDKDNCLTRPLETSLVPELEQSFAECRTTFGKDNVLIVSNSAGTTLDPLGIRAADVSTNLQGTPVLLHQHKKPSRRCAADVVSYFQGRAVNGHLLVIGDRPTTDIALAHRISDTFAKQHKTKHSKTKVALPAVTAPPNGVGVFTTGLWASEGRVNAVMRRLETNVVRALVKRKVCPGQSWPRSSSGEQTKPPDLQRLTLDPTSQGMIAQHAAAWQSIAVTKKLDPEISAHSEERFAFTKSEQPSQQHDMAFSQYLSAWIQRRAPVLAGLAGGVGRLPPVRWLATNLQAGLQVLWLGLAEGLLQAGLWRPHRDQTFDLGDSTTSTKGIGRQQAASTPLFESRPRPASLVASPPSRLDRRDYSAGSSSPNGDQAPSGPQTRKPLPMRNWLAAIAALCLAPAGFIFGARLHEIKEEKSLPVDDADSLADAANDTAEATLKTEDRRRRTLEDEKQKLLLSKYHLERERTELREKLQVVDERMRADAARRKTS